MRSSLLSIAVFLVVACGRPLDASVCEPTLERGSITLTLGGVSFVREVLDDTLCGPAYVAPADLDGDGRAELVVTGYEQHVVFIYRRLP